METGGSARGRPHVRDTSAISDASGTIQFDETKADHSGDGVSYTATKMEAAPDVWVVYDIIRKAAATPA